MDQSPKMPDSRDGRRAALADLSGEVGGGGFFIRRVASPGALAVRGAGKPLARRYMSPSRNKENLLPVWALRATPTKRSPLPGWYPRTPLRDITAIAKAIQRSRARIAAAQQQSQRIEQSPQSVNVTIPAQAEQYAPHIAEASHAVASGSGSTERETVANPATVLADDNLNVSSSTAESSLNTPSKPMDPALADIVEKKLSSSIEKIEKLVRKNLKRTAKAAQASRRATQRRNLMSMR